LIQKFALNIHLARGLSDETQVDLPTVRAACVLSDAVIASHLDTIVEFSPPTAPPAADEVEAQIEIIVARLRVRGRLSPRDLARTFHQQRSDHWMPAVSRAIELGRITRGGDGCFELAEKNPP